MWSMKTRMYIIQNKLPKRTICKMTIVLPGKRKLNLAPINSNKCALHMHQQCSNQRLNEEEKVRLSYNIIHLKQLYVCNNLIKMKQKTWIQTQQYTDDRKGNFTKSLLGDKIIGTRTTKQSWHQPSKGNCAR